MQERAKWLENAMTCYEQSLIRLCCAYLGDIALAEDAVQETFLKAWKQFDSYRGEAAEKTWLTRIAINTCKDVRRSAYFRHVDRAAALDDLPEGSGPFTPQDDSLLQAVRALKPRQREAALLCWYWELSADEAAKALGISRSAVFERLSKARKALQKEMEGWK